MSDIYIQAERELAELLGWTNIVDVGGTLMGQPVEGGVRGQAAIPKWARDNEQAFLLQIEHDLLVDVRQDTVDASQFGVDRVSVDVSDHPSKAAATRFCNTTAVIAKLKAKKPPYPPLHLK